VLEAGDTAAALGLRANGVATLYEIRYIIKENGMQLAGSSTLYPRLQFILPYILTHRSKKHRNRVNAAKASL